ncbi:MAG: helix-turn-helix transcriptional regulator [Clostridium sp.]|uniref:helix-turn-helix domain-containing protein n=1 Tax=Clostridium sp. TaxID=1506 RepID=UPI0025BEDF12|nr:helix-turn-helix transcriptional regulator [Clostridium sp.]MBS4958182.1 helix-turn-helix transcriptional regulator [Clostridium sp.]
MSKENIGERIKELRKNKGIELGKRYTGQMLADELGISRSYLGDIENNRTIPNEIVLSKIADIFDVDLYDIIGENTNIEIDNTPSKEELSKQKVNSIIKRIDNNSAIKSWIKDTDFKLALYKLMTNNNSEIIKELRNKIDNQADTEANKFREINNIDTNEYSLEATRIAYDYSSNYYKFLLRKIMLMLSYELTKPLEYTNSNDHLTPVAAHDKKGNFSFSDYIHDDDLMDDDELWND